MEKGGSRRHNVRLRSFFHVRELLEKVRCIRKETKVKGTCAKIRNKNFGDVGEWDFAKFCVGIEDWGLWLGCHDPVSLRMGCQRVMVGALR